jgi:hypothetical protein
MHCDQDLNEMCEILGSYVLVEEVINSVFGSSLVVIFMGSFSCTFQCFSFASSSGALIRCWIRAYLIIHLSHQSLSRCNSSLSGLSFEHFRVEKGSRRRFPSRHPRLHRSAPTPIDQRHRHHLQLHLPLPRDSLPLDRPSSDADRAQRHCRLYFMTFPPRLHHWTSRPS